MRSTAGSAARRVRPRHCLAADVGSRRAPRGDGHQLLRETERLLRERRVREFDLELICTRAGVTPTAFTGLFADIDELVVSMFDHVSSRVFSSIVLAYRGEDRWVDRVRAALYELLSFVDGERGLARFLVVDSLTGDAAMLARRRGMLERLAAALDEGSPPRAGACAQASFGGDAVVAGVASVLGGCLLEEPAREARSLGGTLMAMIVLPYLGVEAARAELSRGH